MDAAGSLFAECIMGVVEAERALVPGMEAGLGHVRAAETMGPWPGDGLQAIGGGWVQVGEDGGDQLEGQTANDVGVEGAAAGDGMEGSPLVGRQLCGEKGQDVFPLVGEQAPEGSEHVVVVVHGSGLGGRGKAGRRELTR